MPLSHRNHAGWRMVCYLSGMETIFFYWGGTRVGVFVKKKLLDVCAQAKYTKKALKFYASLASRVWVHRVVDEWPVKIFFALPCGMVCCKRSWDEGWFVLFFFEGRPSSKFVFQIWCFHAEAVACGFAVDIFACSLDQAFNFVSKTKHQNWQTGAGTRIQKNIKK